MTLKIQIAEFAEMGKNGELTVPSGELPIQMKHSDGTAQELLLLNNFGADLIRFDAGKGVGNHTHEGDHILLVLKGSGFVEYDGIDYALKPGVAYMVPGSVDHAIKATTELILIAIANDHRPAGSEERLDITQK